MKMSMWLRREIRLACACGCAVGSLSDEQMEAEGGWGSGRVEISDDTERRRRREEGGGESERSERSEGG